MKINVSEILKVPGASTPFDAQGCVEPFKNVDFPLELCGPVIVRGVATSIGDGIYVQANVKGTVKLVCSRCLSPFNREFDLNCEARFVEQERSLSGRVDREDEDDVETFFLEGSQCDLDEMIKHELVLSLPMKPLCSPDCKGLCPVCGKNLNEGECDCERPKEGVTLFGKKLLEALQERSKKNGRS